MININIHSEIDKNEILAVMTKHLDLMLITGLSEVNIFKEAYCKFNEAIDSDEIDFLSKAKRISFNDCQKTLYNIVNFLKMLNEIEVIYTENEISVMREIINVYLSFNNKLNMYEIATLSESIIYLKSIINKFIK